MIQISDGKMFHKCTVLAKGRSEDPFMLWANRKSLYFKGENQEDAAQCCQLEVRLKIHSCSGIFGSIYIFRVETGSAGKRYLLMNMFVYVSAQRHISMLLHCNILIYVL